MTKAAIETTAPRNSNHPPLARDAQGNLLALPENTAGFRIRRHTGGRPKTILAPDRSPVRLPLDTTPEDVGEMFGAGTYRLDAIDEIGQPLDYLTTLVIGTEVGDTPSSSDAPPASGGAPRPGAASDLRFALETITQITRAQSDSLRAIAEAQADWLKGLATAKALPRNGYSAPPPIVPPSKPDETEDHDDEDEDEEPEEDRLQTLVATITPAIAALLSRWTKPREEPEPRNAASEPNAMLRMSRIQARLTPFERKYMRAMLESSRGEEFAAMLVEVSFDEAVEGIQQLAADHAASRRRNTVSPTPAPDFTAQVLAVAAHLDLPEQARVMGLIPRLSQARRDELQAQLSALAPADAANWIKKNLEALEAEVAS